MVMLNHSAKVLLWDNHVAFGNIVFGLASAQHSTGFVGCAAKHATLIFVEFVLSLHRLFFLPLSILHSDAGLY